MFRGFGVLFGRVKALSPLLRSYSVNFANPDVKKTKKLLEKLQSIVLSARDFSSHRTMYVRQSKFMNEKFYDETHFFFMCGLVPCVLCAFIVNIVVGQAELIETPEDYEPRYWEYYKHPITRFLSRYLTWSPQQTYENYLAYVKRDMETRELLAEERWFQQSELQHRDFRGWQFIPVNPAGVLRAREEQIINEEMGTWVSR